MNEEKIEMLQDAGIDLNEWLKGFESVEESVKNSVRMIKKHPLLSDHFPVHGMIIHPKTGELDWVINGYEA